MLKSVRFHSIYYRIVISIVVLFLLIVNQIAGRGIQSITIFDYAFSFDQTQLVYSLLLLILVGIGINFLSPWKFCITQDGIYLRRLDLFVPWRDISGVSYVWLNKASNFSRGLIFYNHKCLVFYRHDYKPICIYNTSILALFVVKLFNSQINTSIIFYLYFFDLNNLSFSSFLLFCLLYFIKVFILPLWLVYSQNSKYGPYLAHSTFFKRNASDVIHV